jgi:acetyl-CoA acyltransferase
MMTVRTAVLVDAVRTPSGRGKAGGALSGIHPVDLFAHVLETLITRTGIDPALVDDVIGGCISQASEQALNVTRSALLAAGFPESVPGTTIDRQCGSSQQAVHFAAQGVLAGAYDIAIAGGVESMSRVPMLSPNQGADSFGPRLRARYSDQLVGQGVAAEIMTSRWKLSRQDLDEFAARSHRLAAEAQAARHFDAEIIEVDLPGGGQLVLDETIRPSTTPKGLAGLRPSFRTEELVESHPELDWHVTPGNSSPLTDGASATLIVEESVAAKLGLRPRLIFRSFAVVGDDPIAMLTAPIPASRLALKRAGLGVEDIDAFEVNEAFAPVPLAWTRELGADPARVNPCGGAIALGHALGSSGTRLFTTLAGHLERTGGKYGLVTMCEGGGMANATVVERV